MWKIWSLYMTHYILPKLSYDYDAFEPFIDKQTMEIHHKIHHQAYVDGLNKSLDQIGGKQHPKYITSILSDLNSVPISARDMLTFVGGGFENHRLFWESLSPQSNKKPYGTLADAMDVYFNGFDSFQNAFTAESLSLSGSGWCWLVFNPTFKRIEIIVTKNEDNPWAVQKIPLLGLDLWEHAYYLKYQNRRLDYITAWWNVVNWDYVCNRFLELAN